MLLSSSSRMDASRRSSRASLLERFARRFSARDLRGLRVPNSAAVNGLDDASVASELERVGCWDREQGGADGLRGAEALARLLNRDERPRGVMHADEVDVV